MLSSGWTPATGPVLPSSKSVCREVLGRPVSVGAKRMDLLVCSLAGTTVLLLKALSHFSRYKEVELQGAEMQGLSGL